ncbi:MAG: sugar phosphate isomerase/epimerase [Lentisphaerae bacterium]|nr:sugar phosphate isomerase/epimerase [Lentisphaerota bacterium]
MFKLGVMVESFRAGLRGGLEAAAVLGVHGIQFYATGGDTHVDRLRGPALAEFKAMLRDLRLEVAAVCGDFGGHGFAIETDHAVRIANTKRVVELAMKLECAVVTTHIGVIPVALDHPRRAVLAKACAEVGRYAHAHGATLAIETGPEPAAVLGAFIADLGLPGGLGVNFDPANLAMVCRDDICAAVRTLAPYIVHTHAKDGINLQPVDAEKLYGAFAGVREPGHDPDAYIRETPLGKGAVPFPAYLSALNAAGYQGYLTVERECGDRPHDDIAAAVTFLRATCRPFCSPPQEPL